MNKCEHCGKETMHERFCCEGHRSQAYRKILRAKYKNEKRCIDCGKKVKPIIIYHARCKKCLTRNYNNAIKLKNNNHENTNK